MLKHFLLPVIFLLLAFGFWVSTDFKVIAAGVAIFLYGMLLLEDGFKAFTGGTLERLLKNSTDTRWKSLSFGVVATSIMQSSSLVSIITISFLSAGLLGLSQGIGIIFGSNIGTTTGAWLVAGFGLKVKLSAYAMPMLVFGVLMIFQKSRSVKGIGFILAGLGFLFLGIHYMKEGFDTFKDSFDLSQFGVSGYAGLFLYTFIGILVTVIMQSSHATLVLTITALSIGQISYENGLALAIGANIGTTITAIIGALSANAAGKRLAGAHLIFNLVTGLIAIVFIHQLITAVDWLSLQAGINEQDYTLKLAVFHSLFNLIGVLVMLPFTNVLVVFLERLIKEKVKHVSQPKFLSEAALQFPDTAAEAVHQETLRMWDNAIGILAGGLSFTREQVISEQDLEQVAKRQKSVIRFDIDRAYELKIKTLYSAIISFISHADVSSEMKQSGELHWMRKANQNIVEAIKDVKHLQKNLLKFVTSYNPEIRDGYNQIRIKLALLIRQLDKVRSNEELEAPTVMLDGIKLELEKSMNELNEKIGHALRYNLITAEMGTSLLNDSTYTYDVARNLIEMSETLFFSHRQGLSQAERVVLLDDEERKQVLDKYEERSHSGAEPAEQD
ncbi:MAG: Na/Pi cotransporter family protein [Chromatiales bacterium]|jgi:phosphate:Na+ symporter